jgi:UDP-N-acetyl-D-glucosamine dehydrogenase
MDFDKKNVIVVGGGYVGLPLAISAQLVGHNVTILDTSKEKVKEIISGERPADFPKCNIAATTDPECQLNADVVLVCVPTPIDNEMNPSYVAIDSAVSSFLENCPNDDCLLVIESTVGPGYTQRLLDKVPSNVTVVFSSERINPGTPFNELSNIPKVVGPADRQQKSLEIGVSFYQTIFNKVIPVESSTIAELSKLLENSFRAVNISFINEFSQACSVFDVNAKDVIDAAATKPFGFMRFEPGLGFGGHCIKCDPYFLINEVNKNFDSMPLLQSAMRINDCVSEYITSRVRRFLSPKRKSILIIGVTYKEDVPDTRESPSISLIEEFRSEGYNVSYHDPLVPDLQELQMHSTELNRNFDLGIVAVKQSCLDISRIFHVCSKILDIRGTFPDMGEGKVIRL